MHIISASDARNSLSDTLAIAQREPVVIQKQGKDIAVVMSAHDYARITSDNIDEFLRFSRDVGLKARALGLTEKALKDILD